MKFRLLSILLAVLLFTGCSARENAENSQNSAAGTATEQMTNSDVSAEPGSATAEDAAAEETYILTFEATTTDGEMLTSDCLSQSRLTMMNVWATYCNPCLSEMPDLGEIAASYDTADFQMIGIVSDVTEEADAADIEYAKELITETSANYTHLLLNESLYVNLVGAVEAVPTTFFVNQEGEVLGYVVGAQSKDAWEEIIDGLLAEEQ